MKRLSLLFLTICIAIVFSVPITSATEVNTEVKPIFNERVVRILEENNIEYQIIDGNLILKENSPNFIVNVNNLVKSYSLYQSFLTNDSYPTPWVHMRAYDIVKSAKFTAATKTALAAVFTEWARSKGLASPYELGVLAAAGFGFYYFINTDKEDLYTFIKYYYREIGPGWFDWNGTFYGEYEIKKEIRITKDSNGTGGSTATDIRESTILEPWF